jgi:ATP-dependent helicase YprA (DUF1998 family)
MTDAIRLFNALRADYTRYYETPFALRDEGLSAERHALLTTEGVMYQRPWLEPVPRYETSPRTVAESVSLAGARPELAALVTPSLFPGERRLYTHQEESLISARRGKNIVVTSGTGSGKTESFLLPLLDALVEESAEWSPQPAHDEPQWWDGKAAYVAQRQGESGRAAAVRGLILYPMNALVEDQLVRLRHVLDSEYAREWLVTHRPGHRFYFGRYTGQTELPGKRDKARIERLRRALVEQAERAARVRDDPQKRYFMAQLDGSEMRSRWDMQDYPPDLLITNYSMLNIMLMRRLERPIIDATRDWLAEDPKRRFTLVVDELHMYRGTLGSEIAYLLRRLLDSLGIGTDPERLRVLATSASAGAESERFDRFLVGLFAAPRSSFVILEGKPLPSDADMARAERAASALRDIGASAEAEDDALFDDAIWQACEDLAVPINADGTASAALASWLDGDGLLLRACSDQSGTRAREDRTVASTLFPNLAPDEGMRALRGLLALLERSHVHRGDDARTLRAHLFFRSVQGFWACSNPLCTKVDPRHKSDARRIGRIYTQPVLKCDCGGRVLDLLYCQTCGEAYLGGYRAPGDPSSRLSCFLVPDIPRLDGLPDRAEDERTYTAYGMYWPSDTAPVPPWTSAGIKYRFVRACLQPLRGELSQTPEDATGYTLNVSGPEADEKPGLPTRCPRCADNWELSFLPPDDPGRARSPIRFMRTGFERVAQVLGDGLLRASPDGNRKLVAFSDSRQDAAKLAVGLEKRHYQDLVRQIAVRRSFEPTIEGQVADAVVRLVADRADAEGLAVLSGAAANAPLVAAAWQAVAQGRPMSSVDRTWSIVALRDAVWSDLLTLGINPAGPDRSFATFEQPGTGDLGWATLFDWTHDPPVERGDTAAEGSAHLQAMRTGLLKEVELTIFARTRRDVESTGLGHVAPPSTFAVRPVGNLDEVGVWEALCSSIRILGNRRRIHPLREEGRPAPPRELKVYWNAVAARHRVDPDALAASLGQQLEDSGLTRQHLLQAQSVKLSAGSGQRWRCSRCRNPHLHASAGICADCTSLLPTQPEPLERTDDYYAHLALEGGRPFRAHVEELTGQTKREDARARQARFQGVFISGTDGTPEIPLVDEIDLLSVTTTMEAGVDIGALRSVLMANMPPMRFNYQQRVGRAGRRGEPLASAVTVCRGRSHDDYYFQHPERITGDPPPTPYLDMRSPEILRRSLLAEALRRAFSALHLDEEVPFEHGDNVHGEFGRASDWPSARDSVMPWLIAHRGEIDELLGAMLAEADPDLQAIRGELLNYVCGTCEPDISEIAASPQHPAPDLSQRLAEAGLLPMLGFPTQQRLLYLHRPLSWPANTVDRAATLAISAFAPGAEIVRDKGVYTCVGVASYRPIGSHVEADIDPLGFRTSLGICTDCGALEQDATPDVPCAQCGAVWREEEQAGYRVIPTAQPLGYRTTFRQRPADYTGWLEWTSRAGRARLANPTQGLVWSKRGRLATAASRGHVWEINDNGGRSFTFAPALSRNGRVDSWVELGAIEDVNLRSAIDERRETAALSARKVTDVVLIGAAPDAIKTGVQLRGDSAARRGAWYSFGFLLRGAAARALDVDIGELEAGLRSFRTGDTWATQAFLSDYLENGAGYSTWLGTDDGYDALKLEALRWERELREHGHPESCDTACYDCLKEYRNMPWHGLLDWRLGCDLLSLLIQDDDGWKRRSGARRAEALQSFSTAFGARDEEVSGYFAAAAEHFAVIAVHPFEDTRPDHLSVDLAGVVSTFEGRGYGLDAHAPRPLRCVTDFDLLRRPGHVFTSLWA